MQNRNYNDPEQYNDDSFGYRRYEQGYEGRPTYNPLPTERSTEENQHLRHEARAENDYRGPEYRANYPSANYDDRNRYNRSTQNRTAYDRSVIDRYGNGRRGESIARGNYGIPGTDRFGNVWYNDPRNRGNENQYPHEDPNRGLAEQFGDEFRSWFGDKEAARRREMDSRNSLGTAWHGDSPNPNGYYDDERDRENTHHRNPDYDRRW